MSSDDLVKDLIGQTPVYTRTSEVGVWEHYQCPLCDDSSAHMGVNQETGRYHCFRCGSSGSLGQGGGLDTRLSALASRRTKEGYSLTCSVDRSDCPEDGYIQRYMASRGVPDPKVGWRYGREALAGHVVFPSYAMDESVLYHQSKRVFKGGVTTRYRSGGNTAPRLDHLPYLRKRHKVLWLVEGPIDALTLRKLYGLWASPTWGSSVKDSFMCDVAKAYSELELDKVNIIFDSEHTAEVKQQRLVNSLKYIYGVDKAHSVRWKEINGDDPGEADPSTLDWLITGNK